MYCKDCSRDTFALKQVYMVVDDFWYEYGLGDTRGFLCLDCLTERVGRPLTWYDFRDLPVNSSIDEDWKRRIGEASGGWDREFPTSDQIIAELESLGYPRLRPYRRIVCVKRSH